MKNLNFKFPIFSLLTIVLFLSCMTSCHDEMEMDYDPEGFMSTTDNADSNEAPDQRTIEPILFANFNADLSKEEAEAKWADMVSDFTKKLAPAEKGVSTEWFTSVSTKTGTQTHNGTNGSTGVYIRFRSDLGIINKGYYSLNAIPHTTGGSWNYYLFRSDLSSNAVSWLEIESANLRLKGRDGWFVTNLNVALYNFHQSINASGFAYMLDSPNIWLDNNRSWQWDYYTSQGITGGRLDF